MRFDLINILRSVRTSLILIDGILRTYLWFHSNPQPGFAAHANKSWSPPTRSRSTARACCTNSLPCKATSCSTSSAASALYRPSWGSARMNCGAWRRARPVKILKPAPEDPSALEKIAPVLAAPQLPVRHKTWGEKLPGQALAERRSGKSQQRCGRDLRLRVRDPAEQLQRNRHKKSWCKLIMACLTCPRNWWPWITRRAPAASRWLPWAIYWRYRQN